MHNGTGALSKALLSWYDVNRRSLPWRDDPSPYHVWVSEIMLQQTRVEAVKGYYARFLARFPDIPSLAEASEDDCLKHWEGLGYYSRARNLQKGARQVMEAYGGQMPQTAKDLQKLSGIGPYTAAAIASIAFGERIPAVDGNLLRIFARLALYEKDIRTPAAVAAARDCFLAQMPADRPGDFNQALMDLGSAVCTPGKPACTARAGEPAGGQDFLCPLAAFCRAFRARRCEEVPVMPVKKPRPVEARTVLVIRCGDRVLLRKRPSRGLLAGLYEFPNLDGWLDEDEALKKARGLLTGLYGSEAMAADRGLPGAKPLREALAPGSDLMHIRRLPDAKHVFTHREWHMRGYEIRVGSRYTLWDETDPEADPAVPDNAPVQAGTFFVPLPALQEKYAIPSAFAAYVPKI